MPESQALFVDNDFCFACGTRNPLGLHLSFYREGDQLCTLVTPKPHWQGWDGVMHGGIQSTIFDDLMSNHLFRIERVWAVTVELSARFRRPVPLDRDLVFRSHVIRRSGKLWELAGECAAADEGAEVLSSAGGRFMQVPHPAGDES
jgi:acyl-coenzyme A thioesterase PaaI-like protein